MPRCLYTHVCMHVPLYMSSYKRPWFICIFIAGWWMERVLVRWSSRPAVVGGAYVPWTGWGGASGHFPRHLPHAVVWQTPSAGCVPEVSNELFNTITWGTSTLVWQIYFVLLELAVSILVQKFNYTTLTINTRVSPKPWCITLDRPHWTKSTFPFMNLFDLIIGESCQIPLTLH